MRLGHADCGKRQGAGNRGAVRVPRPGLMWGVALVLAQAPRSVLACAACYGQSDSPMAQGMNWGIFTLLVVIVGVLGGVAAFFVFLARRAASGRASRTDRAGALTFDVFKGLHCEEPICDLSFPRTRESRASAAEVWIPAFAGMTSRRLLRHDLRSHPAVQKPLEVILRQRIGWA